MPSIKVHSKHCIEMYGVTGEDIHQWMDAPCKIMGKTHRSVRHDPRQEIPEEFTKKYGSELSRNIVIDHIILDKDKTKKDKKAQKHTIRLRFSGEFLQRWLTYVKIEGYHYTKSYQNIAAMLIIKEFLDEWEKETFAVYTKR